MKKNAPVETNLNKSNETATTIEESSTITHLVSSSNIEHEIEKPVDEKKKNLSQTIETPTPIFTNTDKQEVCTYNENGGGILILVDFELTHADKKFKKSHATQRSSSTHRLDAELDALSQILPILACKLTNFNLHEYIEDYDR